MNADTVALALIVLMAPAATLFPIIYGFTSPWHRSITGRALMVMSVGLALLIDISLAYGFLGDDYAFRDAVRLGVFSLILAGVWMQLAALLHEKFWRDR